VGRERRSLHERRRITVSALRKRLGEPWVIATVPGVGYRIDLRQSHGAEGRERD
jgi:two-component system response regulator VanR